MGIAYLAFVAATFYMGYKRMHRKMIASGEASTSEERHIPVAASIFSGMMLSMICITALSLAIVIFKMLYMIVTF